jgi:hypothetical protein
VKLPSDEALSYMTNYISETAALISSDMRLALKKPSMLLVRNEKAA